MIATFESTANESSVNSVFPGSTGASTSTTSTTTTTAGHRLEELLNGCRHATTPQELDASWGALIDHVVDVAAHENTLNESWNFTVVVRQVLVEWPAYNSVYSKHVEDFLYVSGATVVISTCCSILKELGAAAPAKVVKQLPGSSSNKLPPASILQACWATLQRLLLSKPHNDDDRTPRSHPPTINTADLERLVQLILSIPVLVANACHACGVRLPLSATSTKFYPRLIDCSWSNSSGSALPPCIHITTHNDDDNMIDDYRIALLKAFLISRNNVEAIAIGLATHHPLPSTMESVTWSTRERSNLILALLQHCVVAVLTTETSDAEFTAKVLTTCQMFLKSASVEQQEAIVHHLVLKTKNHNTTFSTATTATDNSIRRLCPLVITLLDQSGILLSSLCDVADPWSQWSFCQSVPSHCQAYVSQIIIEGLQHHYDGSSSSVDSAKDVDDLLTMKLLQGVTHRLESFVPEIRLDGMRVARLVARRMNQELHFDELAEAEKMETVTITPTNTQQEDEGKKNYPLTKNSRTSNKKKTINNLSDPDADYDSDDDDDESLAEERGQDVASATDDDDSSTAYDDELLPYSLEDDEEDLLVTAKPLRLLDALELLRTGENDEHAYSHHETAMRSLPDLIRKRPDDLPDVAVSLLLQVLRMENKFGMEDFLQLRQHSLVVLTVEEPLQIGRHLIEEIFKDGTLSDRLACFGALQEAAYELSGSMGLDQRRISSGHNLEISGQSSGYPSKVEKLTNDSSTRIQTQLARLQTKTRRKRSPRLAPTIIKNRFTPIAPMWFYALLGQFLKERDNETLWCGSTGSQLLASFFQTLAVIVEFAGIISAPVLAKDLMELVWPFVDADVAEVRMAVLISVATSISMLPEDQVLSMLLEHGESLPLAIKGMSRTDPDNKCRHLATTIAQSITSVLLNDHNTLLY